MFQMQSILLQVYYRKNSGTSYNSGFRWFVVAVIP